MKPNRSFHAPLALGLLGLGLAALFVFGNQGCSAKIPSEAAFVATATPTLQPMIIDNMEDGNTYLNPSMSGVVGGGSGGTNPPDPLDPSGVSNGQPSGVGSVPKGFWVASTWGDSSNKINANYVTCGGAGANGTDCSIHIFGPIIDHADGQYPSFQLEGKLRGGSYFDASAFTAVRFYYKTGVTGDANGSQVDNCSYRRFNIPIGATTPPNLGGYCASNCFGHFGTTLPSTGGVWLVQNFTFLSLSRVFGDPIVPSTLSGNNLKQVLEVQWQFGRNGASGNSNVNYWVDEIQFVP